MEYLIFRRKDNKNCTRKENKKYKWNSQRIKKNSLKVMTLEEKNVERDSSRSKEGEGQKVRQ